MTALLTALERETAQVIAPVQRPARDGTYYSTVMGRSPLGYWRLSSATLGVEDVANRQAVVSHGYDGLGTVTVAAGLLLGDPDRSLQLAGASLSVPHDAWMDTPDFSMEGLFYLDSVPDYGAVVARSDMGGFGWGLMLLDGEYRFTVGTYSIALAATAAEIVHYVITGDSERGEAKLYFQGDLVTTLPYDSAYNMLDVDLGFGAPMPTFSTMTGRIDEYTLYDRVLTPLEIASDYLTFSLGQSVTVGIAEEVEVLGFIYPGNESFTYREQVADTEPWALWTGYGRPVFNPDLEDQLEVLYDHGGRDHHAEGAGSQVFVNENPLLTLIGRGDDVYLGPEAHEAQRVYLLNSDRGVRRSYDTVATAAFSVSTFLAVSPGAANIDADLPLVCCAPSEGAALFDKCLYLDASLRLCWLTGDPTGVQETIVDPTPFPADGVARHVMVSVGPDGTKIRISGDTVASGSNTASWTEPQHVFLYSGGTSLAHDFGSGVPISDITQVQNVFLAPAIYDRELSEAQSDRIWHLGKSYRNVASYWGTDYLSGTTTLTTARSGNYYRFNWRRYTAGVLGGPDYWEVPAYNDSSVNPVRLTIPGALEPAQLSLLVSDRNDISIEVPDGTLSAYAVPGIGDISDHGVNYVGIQEVRHLVHQPDTLTGTQTVHALVKISSPVINEYLWELLLVNGHLTWQCHGRYGGAIVDTFTHSASEVLGQANSLGLRINGTTVELWVNGAKETFTTTESDPWYVYDYPGVTWGHEWGVHHDLATATYSQQMTGLISDLVSNGSKRFLLPERFFEDLAYAVRAGSMSLGTAYELEEAYPFTYDLPVADQDVTLQTAVESETAGNLHFGMMLGTAFEVEMAQGVVSPPTSALDVSGEPGETTIESETLVFLNAELRLTILEPVIQRAPTSITIVAYGGQAQTPATIYIDGEEVYVVDLDSDGHLGPTSINLTREMGTVGSHTLSILQVTTGGTTGDTEVFTVLRDPEAFPLAPSPDAEPVLVPEALTTENGVEVRHWVFQDLLAESEGGIGSYVLTHNPRNGGAPHHENALTARMTTSKDGVPHIFQAGNLPKEWQFSGYCPTEERQERMEDYRRLNHRFYIIDHHNRAWKVVITQADFVPRLRQTYNDAITDWGSDYTITAVVLDQEWGTPG